MEFSPLDISKLEILKRQAENRKPYVQGCNHHPMLLVEEMDVEH